MIKETKSGGKEKENDIKEWVKLVDHNWKQPKGSLFNSYYTEV